MGEEIALINPTDLTEQLKKEVKVKFINLVDEKHWDSFILKTITDFENKELKKIINDELHTLSKAFIQKWLSENRVFNSAGNGYKLSDAMITMIKENAHTIFAEMMGGMMSNTIMTMENNIRNNVVQQY